MGSIVGNLLRLSKDHKPEDTEGKHLLRAAGYLRPRFRLKRPLSLAGLVHHNNIVKELFVDLGRQFRGVDVVGIDGLALGVIDR